MDEFVPIDIDSSSSASADAQEKTDSVVSDDMDGLSQKLDETESKIDDLSNDVDKLLSSDGDSSRSDVDYTSALSELHDDLQGVQEVQAFSSLVLVILCAVVFLMVGVLFGNAVVKWLRFGNG